ncbi:MAG TPA: hypothetical protein VGT98_08350 [Candidatus Elarobacter sp.]|nr:hypothetical protein [Candidatus Elarobacter sp.]
MIPVLAASLMIVSPAQAQFGGLLKKAKETAAQKGAEKAIDKVGPQAPRAGGEALTATTFNQVLTGVRAADGILTQRDRLREQRKAELATLTQMESQNQGTRNAYEQANSTILSGRESSINDSQRKREADMEARMKGDPQNMARMQMIAMKYGDAMAKAQQRGDTAAYAKAMRDVQAEVLGTDIYKAAKADTAVADAKCGRMPKKPAALAAQDAKDAAVRAMDDSLRTLEARAVTVGAQASGMDKVRYLELKERAFTIYGLLGGQRGVVSYGDDEMDLVRQRKAEIDQYRRAF